MNNARENILKRLKQNQTASAEIVPDFVPSYNWSQSQRIKKFTQHIEAVHGEVYCVKQSNWQQQFFSILQQKSISYILLADTSPLGKEIVANKPYSVGLLDYHQTMESWKSEFFNKVDAGLTSTRGAIAETGSLILWPSSEEPHLISLVPPIHIAVVDADQIYDTFAQAVAEQGWAKEMPSNALLISGPSKTADIEQVLAYGVHGPKELIVIIRE
ncbi:MAG: lactate utilization protein [Pseudomonadota bacterium]